MPYFSRASPAFGARLTVFTLFHIPHSIVLIWAHCNTISFLHHSSFCNYTCCISIIHSTFWTRFWKCLLPLRGSQLPDSKYLIRQNSCFQSLTGEAVLFHPFQIAYLYVPDNEPGCTVKTVVIRPQIEVLTFRRLYITCSHKLTNAFLVLSGATPYHAIVRRPPS